MPEKKLHTELRERAEKLLSQHGGGVVPEFAEEDFLHLLHELEVYQVELELQNEELRRVQHDLENSRNEYVSLYDSAPNAYVTLNSKGLITKFNRKAGEFFDPSKLLVNNTFSSLIYPDDEPTYVGVLKQPVPKSSCELRVLGKGGRILHTLMETATGSDEENGSTLWYLTFSDITERKRAEEASRESEQRYASLFAASPFAMALTSMPEGTAVDVNEAFLRLFEYAREEVIGKTSIDLGISDPELQARVRADLTRNGWVRAFEVARRTKSGRRRDLSISIDWVSIGGAKHVLTTIQDITERKGAESLLAFQVEATRAVAESHSIDEAQKKVLRAICGNLGWDLGILWKADPGTEMLRFEALWHMPGVPPIVIEQSLHPEDELPGRVLRMKKPLWLPGNAEGLVRSGAVASGVSSVLAFPLRAGDTVVAVIECFSRSTIDVTSGMIQALETIGHQWGNYWERKMAEASVRKAAEELEARVKQRTEQLAGALEALSNSEMRFRAMFEGAPLGIALLNAAGTIIERNPTLERMFGYQQGGLYGMSVNALMYAEDLHSYEEEFARLLDGSQVQFRVELRCLRQDGSVLWGSLSCSSMYFEGTVSPFIIMMIKDVTERREMIEEFRASENRFRTIFEESPIGIALVDRDGRFIQVSHIFTEMIGSDAEELLTQNISDFAYAEDGRVDHHRFQGLVEGRWSRYQMELRFRRKDGSLGWGNLNAVAIRAETGDFLYSLRLLEDITLRKDTEKRMQMLAHTITSMQECVVITDVDLAIISVNEAFLKTFGYEEKEILGKHISALRPPGTSSAELTGIFEGTMLSAWTGELQASRKNGEAFPMLLSTSVVREETGNPIALVGIARDITEQRRLQEKLAETEKRRVADLRRFATSVQRAQEDERQRISRELHDDICQRLSGMKLNLEVLEDDFKSRDKKTYRTLRTFKKQFEQAITEVRRLSSNLRPTVLDDFGLTIALNLLGREFEKAHKIPVRVELGDPVGKHLDPQIEIALYRIAQESLTNIAKHANASHVALRLALNGSRVVLTVNDNGKGFDLRDVPHSQKSGHGLGLISMRERTELLGGTWEIQSAPHEGTTIHVTIPVEGSTDHEENQDRHRG
jgi:PAS domain S-box-containing protein